MGATASVSRKDNVSSSASMIYDEDGLNKEVNRLRKEGNGDAEIYQSLRQTYGSVRKQEFVVLNVTVQNLALKQLSHTLHENRIQFQESQRASGSVVDKSIRRKKKPNLQVLVAQDEDENDNINHNVNSPHVMGRRSPSGALHVGNFTLDHKGLKLSENESTSDFQLSGRSDFVEIRVLGSGATGKVVEAIHIPTMTIVALKMLSINNGEDAKHIYNELEILYQNLVELKLVDTCLDEDDWESTHERDNNYSNSVYNAAVIAAKLASQEDGEQDCDIDTSHLSNAKVSCACRQLIGMYDGTLPSLLFN